MAVGILTIYETGYLGDYKTLSNGNGFHLKDFLTESLVEGINGGLARAAFFGLGQGIEKLREGIWGAGKGGDRNVHFS